MPERTLAFKQERDTGAAARLLEWRPRAREGAVPPRLQRRTDTFAAGRVVSIETNEFDEFNDCATGWSVEHHALGPGNCRSMASFVMTDLLQVGEVRHST